MSEMKQCSRQQTKLYGTYASKAKQNINRDAFFSVQLKFEKHSFWQQAGCDPINQDHSYYAKQPLKPLTPTIIC